MSATATQPGAARRRSSAGPPGPDGAGLAVRRRPVLVRRLRLERRPRLDRRPHPLAGGGRRRARVPRCCPRHCWSCSAVSSPTGTTPGACSSPASSGRRQCWFSAPPAGPRDPRCADPAGGRDLVRGRQRPDDALGHGPGAADRGGRRPRHRPGLEPDQQPRDEAARRAGRRCPGGLGRSGGGDAGRRRDLRGDRRGARPRGATAVPPAPGHPGPVARLVRRRASTTCAATTPRSCSWWA